MTEWCELMCWFKKNNGDGMVEQGLVLMPYKVLSLMTGLMATFYLEFVCFPHVGMGFLCVPQFPPTEFKNTHYW